MLRIYLVISKKTSVCADRALDKRTPALSRRFCISRSYLSPKALDNKPYVFLLLIISYDNTLQSHTWIDHHLPYQKQALGRRQY